MAGEMKAVQITGREQASIVLLPIPEPGPGQVLVKVQAVSTCPQWDMHVYYDKPMVEGQPPVPYPYMPGQPGHEMTGIIAKVGAGCTLAAGQRVASWRDQGNQRQGCYAEYVIMEEINVLPVPEELPYQKIVSLELAMCVAASILRLKQTVGIAGKKCGVNGLGPAGLIAVQMMLAEGAAEVVGIDPNPVRRELALALGAAAACQPQDPALVERGNPGCIEVAIDCAGFPEAVSSLMDRTEEAVVLFAVKKADYILRHYTLSVIGYPGHSREAAEYALQLIVANKLDMSPLISYELPFARYGEAVALLRSQAAIKIGFVTGREE